MPPGRWDECVARDGGCMARSYGFPTEQRCDGKIVVHHRRPKGMGGSPPWIHDLTNLVTLCDTHHVEVHARPTISYECGLLVRR